MKRIDLTPFIERALEEFSNAPPQVRTLQKWVGAVGFLTGAEALLIAKGLLLIWGAYKAGARKSPPACKKLSAITGKRCGAPFIHSEIVRENGEEFVLTVCEQKHSTKMRIK